MFASSARRLAFVVCLALSASTALTQNRDVLSPLIRLQSGTIDTRREPRAAVEAATAPAWYLLQVARPLTRADRAALQKQLDVRLNEYIPNLTYVEKLSPAALRAASADPRIRWIGPYRPEYKISPRIGTVKYKTPSRQSGGLMLTVTLFPDADPQAVVAAAKKRDGRVLSVQDDTKTGGPKRVVIIAPSAAIVAQLAALPEVNWIEETPERLPRNGTTTGVIQSGTVGTTPIWNAGLHGEGSIIGIIDGLLDINHCFFMDNVNNTPGTGHRKVVAIRNAAGGGADGHGTHTAGTLAGDDANNSGTAANRGIAWAARLTFGSLDDIINGTSINSYLTAAHNDGAHIHSNSWGSGDSTYDQDEVDFDTFAWNHEDDAVVVASNEGVVGVASPVASPEGAKNSLAVNASNQSPDVNNLCAGAMGPTADGRRKPEIFAPGCGINSAQASSACGTDSKSGTSMACPAIAAAADLVRQYYTEGWYPSGTREPHNAFLPSGALIKATMLNGTVDMTGTGMGGYPGNTEGWGLLRLNNVLFLPGGPRDLRVWDVPHAQGLSAGDAARTHVVNVATNAQALKVTLVWTEPPAAVGAAAATVNDLNLTVTSPDGTQVFLGNNFAGGVSTTGGAADTVNNVEMVLVNNPTPGNWTATVTPVAVNVGNPGQGYALVATADMPAPPSTIGTQNTLVVRVNFPDPDLPTTIPLAGLQSLMTNVIDYYHQSTYNQVDIVPTYREVTLTQNTAHYYAPSVTPLVELTQDVVNAIVSVAADANIFNNIDRLILVTNDDNFNDDWATTGPWPYDLPGGFTRPISVSIQGMQNNEARFNHGLGHQFNLVDLYAHPGVTFPRPYASNWDNMARPYNNVQFLTWSKERALWISTPGAGSQIQFVPRPAANTTTGPIHLFNQESAATNKKMIAIGLTNGVTALANETQFYVVESRDKTAAYESSLPGNGAPDSGVPSSGVLIYLVNRLVPQGEGPVILRDGNATTTSLLEWFTDGANELIPGTGITVHVAAGTAGGAHDITIDYNPPVTTHNLHITAGDTIGGQFYSWFSPDIWLDSPKNGFNLSGNPPPSDDPESPVVGMVNRIMVKIINDGGAPAENFDVRVRISQPYHTLGDQADFNTVVGIQHIGTLMPNMPRILAFDWTPIDTGENHSCVWAEFINTTGTDTNPNDNAAQENLEKLTSVTGSPFHPVDFHFQMKNPYSSTALFYFRMRDLPPKWSVVINPPKVMLNAGQSIEGVATITPPPDEKLCTSRYMEIASWTPRGDTLIPVGGSVVQVDLRKPTLLTLDTGEEKCHDGDLVGSPTAERHCRRVTAHGCTDPPQPNQLIWVKYTSPTGQPVWHQVMTDASGCFDDFLAVGDSSTWSVTAGFDGNTCQGPATVGPKGGGGRVPPFGDTKNLWYSMHLGHNFALGDFRKSHQSGPSITFDLERAYRERFGLYAMLGYHYFDARQAGIDDEWITNLSLNLRAYAPAGPWLRFVGIGPGIYRDRAGTTSAGANVSFGLDFPLQPKFMGEVGADLHVVRPGGDRRFFLDLKLGFKWQF